MIDFRDFDESLARVKPFVKRRLRRGNQKRACGGGVVAVLLSALGWPRSNPRTSCYIDHLMSLGH